MMKLKLLTLLLALSFSQINAQKALLQSGPMVGYSEMLEVMLWAQTTEAAEVKIKYTAKDNSENSFWTNTVKTCKEKAFTAHLLADSVSPGTEYEYTVYINNQPVKLDYECRFETLPIWKWRGDPPAFSFASGSGTYINEKAFDRPGKGYGDYYRIFESIAEKSPDFMLWLGDNNYLREPDWNTRRGIQHRNTHTRSTKELQALLAKMHHYAIWDDHDYGPNNSDKSYMMKDVTLEVFKQFWANPSYGTDNMPGAISYFNWNDCDFFLLDNRFYRDANYLKGDNKTILGEKQKEWLKNALVFSQANFKFVVMGGQFLNDAGFYETYINYGFNNERKEIIDFIQEHNIKNVIFITGDRHHSEISLLKEEGKPVIYDITGSPLTSGTAGMKPDENNTLRIKDSYIYDQRNFTLINVSGSDENRTVEAIFYDSDGKELYQYQIKKEN